MKNIEKIILLVASLFVLVCGCSGLGGYVLQKPRQSITICPVCDYWTEMGATQMYYEGDNLNKKIIINYVICMSLWCGTESSYTNIYIRK